MEDNNYIKINKKHLMIAIVSIGFFALGNMLSFADTNNSKVVLSKETMTVGSVVFRLDDKNPADIYGGTWELIKGDATIEFGDGNVQTGTIIGSNEKTVPLPAHTHTATFTGNALPPHNHKVTMHTSDGTDNSSEQAFSKHSDYSSGTVTSTSVSAGTPTGTVTINNSGVSNAKMDVRGARVLMNVWKRVS